VEEFDYMPIQDTIGCLTHIECSMLARKRSFASHYPVWVLVREADKPESEVPRRHIANDSLTLKHLNQRIENGLLRILHTGWLDRNDPRLLERFRDGDNPYGTLVLEFQDMNMLELSGRSAVWHKEFLPWQYAIEPFGPLKLFVFTVSRETISRGPWPMLWDQLTIERLLGDDGK